MRGISAALASEALVSLAQASQRAAISAAALPDSPKAAIYALLHASQRAAVSAALPVSPEAAISALLRACDLMHATNAAAVANLVVHPRLFATTAAPRNGAAARKMSLDVSGAFGFGCILDVVYVAGAVAVAV